MPKKPANTGNSEVQNLRHVSLNGLHKLLNRDRNTISKWTENEDFPVVQRADKENNLDWVFDVADVVRWREKFVAENAKGATTGNGDPQAEYDEARASKEKANAYIAWINYDERVCSVVLIDDVVDKITEEYALLRSGMESVAGDIAADLINIENASDAREIVDKAVREKLKCLAYDQQARKQQQKADEAIADAPEGGPVPGEQGEADGNHR